MNPSFPLTKLATSFVKLKQLLSRSKTKQNKNPRATNSIPPPLRGKKKFQLGNDSPFLSFLLGGQPREDCYPVLTSSYQTHSLEWEQDPDGLIELKGKVRVL